MKTAIVIGSGIAGIASAIRLSQKGFKTIILEKNNYPGGKLSEIKLGNYRFDAGPSLFTLPNLVTELFELCNKNPGDYFTYEKCDITCNYFFDDKTKLSFYSDKNKLAEEISKKLGVTPINTLKYLQTSEFKHISTEKTFLEKSLHKFSTYLSNDILKTIIAIPKLDLFKSLNQYNNQTLNHPKLVQIFNRYATYNGSSPYLASGILSLIPHLELNIGSFFPTKGMYSITQSLVNLAKDLGVEFIYNTEVENIEILNNNLTKVKTVNEVFETDLVICNADVKTAYNTFLKDLKKPKKILNQERSSSGIIFYWGINREFKELDLHNILFSNDYKSEFECIFDTKQLFNDPTVYINVTSKKNKNDAPKGHENWFVMINTPAQEGNSDTLSIDQARQFVINKINKVLNTDISKHIVLEDYLDPKKIELKTSSFGGALYGSSSNSRNAAFFRHNNQSKIKNLYFVGGSVHPGGGIPLCLNSAKIVSDMLD